MWTIISSLRARRTWKHWIRFTKSRSQSTTVIFLLVYKLWIFFECATINVQNKRKWLLNLQDWQLGSIGESATRIRPQTEPNVFQSEPPSRAANAPAATLEATQTNHRFRRYEQEQKNSAVRHFITYFYLNIFLDSACPMLSDWNLRVCTICACWSWLLVVIDIDLWCTVHSMTWLWLIQL